MNTFTKQIVSRLIPITMIFITVYSVVPYFRPQIPLISTLENTTLWWGVSIMILFLFILSKKYYFDKKNDDNMLIVWIYLLWNAVCIIRGMFVAEMYWDWKALTGNAMSLLLPIVIFSSTNKRIVQSMMSFYLKYVLPIFFLFAILIRTDAYGFYLVPATLLMLLFPALTRRQKLLTLTITVIVLVADLGARSNVIKFGVPMFILVFYYLKNWIPSKTMEIVRVALIVIPFVFFGLGVSGVFNVFNMDEYIGEVTSQGVDGAGERGEQNLAVDTRTFLYVEVLESAINNNYWLLGRTPARGNDSYSFGLDGFEVTGRYERLANEIGLANVFTWTGLIGVIIYLLIFYRASFLAVNRSKNIYVKMLGVFIAFRWLYSWIEDLNNFSLNYFMLMVMLGLCFSRSFRMMSDNEVVIWARGFFDVRYVRLEEYLSSKSKEKKREGGRLINVAQHDDF